MPCMSCDSSDAAFSSSGPAVSTKCAGRDRLIRLARLLLVVPWLEKHGLLETRGKEIVGALLDAGFRVAFNRNGVRANGDPELFKSLRAAHGDLPLFTLETDMRGSTSLFDSDIMVRLVRGCA